MDTWRNDRYSGYKLAAVYLAAIVAANISVVILGPAWSIVNAFLFIGLTLTTRDKLHDIWRDNLTRNMALLILLGCGISALFGAGRIALASAIAFGLSESADAIMYHALRRRRKLAQVNGSNLIGALVDSIVFPLLAFGWPPLIPIMAGQFLAKTLGGAVWSVIIYPGQRLRIPER